MRKKLILRIWLFRLARYFLLPAALCVILFPLYGILHKQTVKAQLSDTAEQLAASVSIFESYLYDIRFVTNKLFYDSNYAILAVSQDKDIEKDDISARNASKMLEELTYGLSPVAYSYVTFGRNHIVIDESRVYHSYESFYPGTLDYENISLEQWSTQLHADKLLCLPVQPASLYRTAYPDSYMSVTQPFFDSNGRYMGSCTMLLREKQLINLFLPPEEWRNSGMFYIVREDGTLLQSYHCDDAPVPVNIQDGNSVSFDGQDYLVVSREIPSLNAVAVIGLPYEVYAENLHTINRAICFYIMAGLLACIILSAAMTWLDMRHMRPVMETLGQQEKMSGRLMEEMVVQKLRSHNQLSMELEKTHSQLEYGRMETLLKTGYVNSPADQRLLSENLRLTKNNYLLLIPASQESQEPAGQGLRLLLIAEQLEQCLGQLPVIHNAADGSALAVLSLEDESPESYAWLCSQLKKLYKNLNMDQNLTLSARFQRLEQISSVYWQVRNASSQYESTEQVRCLSNQIWEHVPVPEVAMLERLREALLSGQTDGSQALVIQMFGSDDLTPEDFLQIFYSIRGVVLTVAEKVECEDIYFLCTYDRRKPMKKLIQNICECCLVICNHIDAMKQSHNAQLQQGILQWLAENFAREDLNMAMVADHFGISKKYVSLFLKDQTGKSYNEYLEELRLSHARKLLQSSDLSITEIAASCGFSTQNTFYKAFRRRYELSPSAVRRNKIS